MRALCLVLLVGLAAAASGELRSRVFGRALVEKEGETRCHGMKCVYPGGVCCETKHCCPKDYKCQVEGKKTNCILRGGDADQSSKKTPPEKPENSDESDKSALPKKEAELEKKEAQAATADAAKKAAADEIRRNEENKWRPKQNIIIVKNINVLTHAVQKKKK